MRWYAGGDRDPAGGPGLRPGALGLRHVRPAGRADRRAASWPGRWAENLAASRECNRFSANVGDTVAVVLNVQNTGALPVAWVLLEDLLPRDALGAQPPKLTVLGQRLQLAMLGTRARKTLYYQAPVQQPRLLPDRAAGAGDGRPVRAAPPLARC